ncbi:arsenic resistance N-acetyltransferase ArsN2 [Gemmatimonas sp. UBA7669]|uniref:arsenic resistance N-acetyltransferase ArsN2 n=1 Tax=Gemmatimonas sp. UBA7669 TaxID=1946568 RepID=UPI0025C6C30B|nr:arsenic resistance N-acetyltransferase ArsN2 [Gemmatimonas sp. UBA7669]
MTAAASATPVFRAARAEDQPAVEALLTSHALPLAGVPEMFAANPSQFLLAEHVQDIVAVAGVEECCAHALLRSVAVRGDWQKRGLGHELVARAVAQAESRGIAALYLLTMTAEHYFPRFGFTRVSRDEVPAEVAATVEFTSACPASAVTMRKTLQGTA